MAGSLALSAGQQWPPSHVQVTVLRARGLRAKGKQGSDAFTIIQLGRERFCTAVVEKSLEPVWREECSFELLPDWLEPAAAKELLLTVLHRSLMGLDRFLGQLSLPLAALYQDSSKKPRWYKLSSKPGQKEKERGEIQVSIQFVRNNLTASMFDLSSKEKHRSALDKLKDKVKGKKKHDSLTAESASAIVPSSVGQITSDEEFSEKGTPEKKSKKSFFSKPKLHRSSLTKSNSSLSSQQSVRSLESISNSTGVTNLPSPKATSAPGAFHPPPNEPIATNPSLVKVLTHKRALSDEVNQAFKSNMDLLAPKTSPISRSLLCINGSHIYNEEHSPKSPSGLFPKSTPLSRSFQNVASKAEEPGQRTSVEETDKQKWAAGNVEVRMVPPVITVNNEESTQVLSAEGQRKEVVGSVQGTKPVHIAAPIISTVEPTKSSVPHEAKKASIFPFGSDNKDSESRRSRTPSPVRKCSSLGERTKSSGWFLKEANHKPSPHPVKPITATAPEGTEKKAGRSCISNTLTSGLEKLKNVTTGSISPIKLPVSGHDGQEAVKESKLADPVVQYYHLTHDELIKKILQQESELQKKEEHIRDLEEYIDLLLVQIMEQNPSILQSVSEKMKNKTAAK
ncbi:rab11 family-interacting protein 5-like isoform X2 [Pristis pectinata]|uniref:rab11 family-interacting protein 5-like isoform X2 n=1 Tax=Pristis pectinata TaxID=685728 RepID=UPI00223DD2CC|nr:rab11 family-interacting protein 5-like isoform X2 [Pristis pectinata]